MSACVYVCTFGQVRARMCVSECACDAHIETSNQTYKLSDRRRGRRRQDRQIGNRQTDGEKQKLERETILNTPFSSLNLF